MIKNLEMIHISLINPRKLQLDSAVKSLLISLYAITFCLKWNFGSLSVSCLTINLFRKTSMTEFQIVSNWNRADTSWKRSFTSTLKLWAGMYWYVFIILHMSVLIEYLNAFNCVCLRWYTHFYAFISLRLEFFMLF